MASTHMWGHIWGHAFKNWGHISFVPPRHSAGCAPRSCRCTPKDPGQIPPQARVHLTPCGCHLKTYDCRRKHCGGCTACAENLIISRNTRCSPNAMHCVYWRGLGVGRPGSNLRSTKRAGAAGASWRATGLRAGSESASRSQPSFHPKRENQE